MTVKLYNCDCLYEETINNANTNIKGYSIVNECAICKTNREVAYQIIIDKKVQDDVTEVAKKVARESFKQKLLALGTFTQEEIDSIL